MASPFSILDDISPANSVYNGDIGDGEIVQSGHTDFIGLPESEILNMKQSAKYKTIMEHYKQCGESVLTKYNLIHCIRNIEVNHVMDMRHECDKLRAMISKFETYTNDLKQRIRLNEIQKVRMISDMYKLKKNSEINRHRNNRRWQISLVAIITAFGIHLIYTTF